MSLLKEKMQEKRVSQQLMIRLLRNEGLTIDAARMSMIVNDQMQTPKARKITNACYSILERM